MTGVGNADVADRFGFAGHVAPHAQHREKPLAGVGDGGGAAVEAGVGKGLQRHPVDQRGPQARLAGGKRQQAAIEAGAHDRKIEPIAVHGP